MYYDATSGYYVNNSKGIRFPKAEIVDLLRNFGEDRFFDEYGRVSICLSSDFSTICGGGDKQNLNKFIESILRLCAHKTIPLEVWLGIVFLATELYPYNGDDDTIEAYYRIPLHAYDLYKKDYKSLRQVLEMLTMIGYNICSLKLYYEYTRRYEQNELWLSDYEVGAFKIIFWKMFDLGLGIGKHGSTKFIRECYAEYVRNLTLFNLLYCAIKN